MTRLFDPRPRRYTELCNRIGSPRLGPPHAQMCNADPLEDYWEDASVSLRSCHSWEAPTSAWLDASTLHISTDGQIEEGKRLPSQRIRSCRYSFDASYDCLGSSKSRRSFPPPLASCSTLSIKGGGRFVLKEMDADRPQGFFQAQRGNGRLLLRLVLPDEMNEERASTATSDDGEDDDNDIENDDGEDEGNSSVMECVEEAGPGLSEDFSHVGSDSSDEELAGSTHHAHTSSLNEMIERSFLEGMGDGVVVENCSSACLRIADEGEVFNVAGPSRGSGLQEGRSSTEEACARPMSQKGIKEGEVGSSEELQRVVTERLNSQLRSELHLDGSFLEESRRGTFLLMEEGHLEERDYLHSIDLRHIVADSSCGAEKKDLLGVHQQESMWNVDVPNHAMSSLSPWSPNQMCLHQSIVNMRPALGLAIS